MRGSLNSGLSELHWIEFFDPENELRKFRVNLTFVLSAYNCIYGQGCPGLLNRGVQPDVACCERGVTFPDDEDFTNVENSVSQLTEEDCDNLDHVRNKGWYLRTPKGKPYKTRKLFDRCIFSNREGGPTGKPGCAFHHLAERTGQNMIDLKPFICWTNPVRFDETMESDVSVLTITAFDADDWGGTDDSEEPNGHGYMGYWCIDTPDAYNGKVPMYVSQEAELRKMMGDSGYVELCTLIEGMGLTTENRPSKMPGEVKNDGRPLLPLLIEQRKDVRPSDFNPV